MWPWRWVSHEEISVSALDYAVIHYFPLICRSWQHFYGRTITSTRLLPTAIFPKFVFSPISIS
jgi:hypothetical protein